tara:strand:+ start:198 stop:461 length:264 start_codon:yes stop_codon:yes gene_type:complete
MIVKQKVVVEKEFLRPSKISEKKWIEYWQKNSNHWGKTEDDFHNFHQETFSSDLEILETTFVWKDKTKAPDPVAFTDKAIEKLEYPR